MSLSNEGVLRYVPERRHSTLFTVRCSDHILVPDSWLILPVALELMPSLNQVLEPSPAVPDVQAATQIFGQIPLESPPTFVAHKLSKSGHGIRVGIQASVGHKYDVSLSYRLND